MLKRVLSNQIVRSMLVLAVASLGPLSCAQDTSSAKPGDAKQDMQAAKGVPETGAGESEFSDRLKLENKASPTGRLPRYFAKVVDQKQRLRIYEIQTAYREKIAELERQLAALKIKQMQEIEQVLTASQLKRIEEMRARPRSLVMSNPDLDSSAP